MKTSVRITKEAKNNTFEGCKIYGGVESAGQNTIFRKTIIGINQKLGEHPIIYGILSTVVGGIVLFFVTQLLEKI
ncbi:MAG: hypothetical protein Q8L10_04755 [Candidatus Moranbacteria bacterium]|nr:hypothetical protein [Candidatus Moranbacteria bacterium]